MRRLKGRWQEPEPSLRKLRAKVEEVTHLLERRYGVPRRRRVNPLDVLIQTILSQNTNDRNRDRAYRRLKSRFPLWEDILKAKMSAIIQAIRPGGLADKKARRIGKILRWIEKREGRLSLAFLRRMSSEEIIKTLGTLKGIGPKTVHCVLLFGLGREAFPVDTHILRVGKRLGFVPENVNAEKAHLWMAPLVPKGKSLSLHLNLIRLGREICRAKNPLCLNCFLKSECLHSHRNDPPIDPLSLDACHRQGFSFQLSTLSHKLHALCSVCFATMLDTDVDLIQK